MRKYISVVLSHQCCAYHSVMSDSLRHHGLQPARLLCPWGFSRQENWSWLSCPPPGDLPNPGIKPRSPALQGPWLPLTNALQCFCASFVAQLVKNLPAMQETWVRSLGWGDPVGEGMATHSSILVWRIPMDRED